MKWRYILKHIAERFLQFAIINNYGIIIYQFYVENKKEPFNVATIDTLMIV